MRRGVVRKVRRRFRRDRERHSWHGATRAGGSVSPILIRPIREQIEHDRIIRVLHARLRKEYDVEANLGDDRRAPLRVGRRDLLSRPRAHGHGRPEKVAGHDRGGDRRVGQPPRGDGRSGRTSAGPRRRSTCMCRVGRRHRATAHRGLQGQRHGDLELPPVGDQVHFWLVRAAAAARWSSVTDSIVIAGPPAAEPPPPLTNRSLPPAVEPAPKSPPAGAEASRAGSVAKLPVAVRPRPPAAGAGETRKGDEGGQARRGGQARGGCKARKDGGPQRTGQARRQTRGTTARRRSRQNPRRNLQRNHRPGASRQPRRAAKAPVKRATARAAAHAKPVSRSRTGRPSAAKAKARTPVASRRPAKAKSQAAKNKRR